ncbi:hypothetical protein C9374_009771 [Naegleria lovaniensis]|uniref:histidine--tRNA ligase n=1 Tax=Naegleria lovaniensis TaxID=51637 RepID=A0AA88GZ09_NAELO|nr:uncharacterized protein C9374_009771 [Naegleria lovaniensis]KAG2393194.1 hypothetical protein C9374_009771 [Naegleria lovaniensis]
MAKVVKGMADFLPSSFSTNCYQKIVRVGEKICKTFDYQFMQTPIVEERRLFERTLGTDTDIISKEMFLLAARDPSEGNKLCLRPENTASIMRSIIENSLSYKQRIYYYGPMFRYERPQKGRQRQFHQFGVECLGSDHYQSDLESLELAFQFLSGVLDGRTDLFTLEINSIGTLEEREAYQIELLKFIRNHLDLFFRQVEKSNTEQEKHAFVFSQDTRDRIDMAIKENNPRRVWRILDSKQDEALIEDAIKNHGMPQLQQFQSEQNRIRFENVLKGLSWLNIPYVINPSLIRGLDYYTHTTFEFKSTNIGAKSTILAGGRYDTLAKQLGSPNMIPAVGWASGIERLTILMEELEKNKTQPFSQFLPKVFVAVIRGTESTHGVSEDDLARFALNISQQLRSQGFTVNYLEKGNLSKQLKHAQSNKCLLSCIIGDEEYVKQQVLLKNLDTGAQQHVSLENLGNAIHSIFNS